MTTLKPKLISAIALPPYVMQQNDDRSLKLKQHCPCKVPVDYANGTFGIERQEDFLFHFSK